MEIAKEVEAAHARYWEACQNFTPLQKGEPGYADAKYKYTVSFKRYRKMCETFRLDLQQTHLQILEKLGQPAPLEFPIPETAILKSPQLAEAELKFKLKVNPSQMPVVTCSSDIYHNLRTIWDDETLDLKEEFMVMYLNRANRILGWSKISTGGVAGTVADPKIIFSGALLSMASSIILAHNHPSGNTKPSSADITLTRKAKEAGQLLDMPVLDHVIVTREDYYSFADEGML